MNSKKILLHFLVAICAIACSEKKDQAETAAEIYAESMKIHDEVMPRMDEMFTLRQKLASRLDSPKGERQKNESLIQAAQHAIDDLKAADEAMMDWMHHVKDVAPGDGHSHHGGHAETSVPAGADIQKDQKKMIEQVRKDMEESIANAKRLLRN
jgi:hypothetical protein